MKFKRTIISAIVALMTALLLAFAWLHVDLRSHYSTFSAGSIDALSTSGFVVSTATTDTSAPTSSLADDSWGVLTDEDLGIRLKVPQTINSYNTISNPQGCDESLILSESSGTSVFLVPQFSSCDKDATSNVGRADPITQGAGSSPDAKITVVPVDNLDAIAAALQEVVGEGLPPLKRPGGIVIYNNSECQSPSVNVVVPNGLPADDGTFAVSLDTTSTCALFRTLTVRYSPRLNKLVIVEPASAYADYDFGDDTASIYASIEVFK